MSRSVGEHVRCPEGTLINGRFKVMREIGCGNFAKVYKCTDVQHPSSTPVAVKILKKEYAADAAFEADILKALNAKDSRGHKVVRMLDQFTWSRCPCFVFGLRGAALRSRKFGVARGHVSMDEIRAFTKEMMVTLAFLHHDVRMVHTDLKPENILIDDEVLPSASNGIGTGWTIADFGSASFYNPAKPDSDLISTRPYRAPEVVLGMPWSTKADVFSMGCIIFELYYGARLFEVNEDAEHLGLFEKRIAKLPLNFTRTSKNFRRFFDADGKLLRAGASSGFNSARPSAIGGAAAAAGSGARHLNEIVGDDSLRDLLMAMLEIDPTRRITAQDCLRHDFLTGGKSSRAVSPLRAQMERMSLGGAAADTLQQPKVAPRVAAPAPSTAAYLAPRSSSTAAAAYEKENAPSSYAAGLAAKQSAKISPPVPSFGGAMMPSAADRGYLPASARAGPGGLGEARNANSGAYAAAYHHHQPTSARDMPAAGKPSAAYTPRYAFGGWQ